MATGGQRAGRPNPDCSARGPTHSPQELRGFSGFLGTWAVGVRGLWGPPGLLGPSPLVAPAGAPVLPTLAPQGPAVGPLAPSPRTPSGSGRRGVGLAPRRVKSRLSRAFPSLSTHAPAPRGSPGSEAAAPRRLGLLPLLARVLDEALPPPDEARGLRGQCSPARPGAEAPACPPSRSFQRLVCVLRRGPAGGPGPQPGSAGATRGRVGGTPGTQTPSRLSPRPALAALGGRKQ